MRFAIGVNYNADKVPMLVQVSPVSGQSVVLHLDSYRIIHHRNSLVKGDRPAEAVYDVVN